MIWIVILGIFLFFVIKMTINYQKDSADLQEKSLHVKFHVIISRINEHAFDSRGKITSIDKRECNLYEEGANQIIYFLYSQGTLAITWKYKYFQKEIVHKKTFLNCRNLSLFEQGDMASRVIEEMERVIIEHKNSVLPPERVQEYFQEENSKDLDNSTSTLHDLSKMYKEAVVSLLIVLAGGDQEITGGIQNEEFEIINEYADKFGLTGEFTLLERLGLEKIIEMVQELSEIQKEEFYWVVQDLLKSDGEINLIEEEQTDFVLKKIGVPTYLLL